MSKRLKAVVTMIEKIDSPEKIWLGEQLLEQVHSKFTPEEMAEAQAALFLQKIYTDILFI